MSNLTKFLLGLLGVLLLAFFCTSCHHTAIEGKLKSAVTTSLRDPAFEQVQLGFEGAVGTLTGTVRTEAEKQEALRAARQTAGFLFPIKDELKVLGEMPLTQADGGLLANIQVAFDPNGKVSITGTVPDTATRTALLKAAEARYGVGNVLDKMAIDPKAAPFSRDVTPVLDAFLSKAASLQGGALDITGDAITLTGTVQSDSLKASLGKAAQARFPHATVYNQLVVNAPDNPQLQASLNDLALQNIEFETASASIKSNSQTTVQKAATYLKTYATNAVEIQGHTDNDGRAATNQRLSQKRAEAVLNALVKLGVPNPSRLTAKGYGASNPIADNATAEGRKKNRRVVFVVQ